MPPTYDPVTGRPVCLDRAQPLCQVDATLALLRAWVAARPLKALSDAYVYGDEAAMFIYKNCRN